MYRSLIKSLPVPPTRPNPQKSQYHGITDTADVDGQIASFLPTADLLNLRVVNAATKRTVDLSCSKTTLDGRFSHLQGNFSAFVTTPDNRVVVALSDHSIQIFNLETNEFDPLHLNTRINKPILGLAVSPDNRLFVSTRGGRHILSFDINTGRKLETDLSLHFPPSHHDCSIHTLAISSDSKFLVGANNHAMQVWNFERRSTFTLPVCEGSIASFVFRSAHEIVLSSDNRLNGFWDLETRRHTPLDLSSEGRLLHCLALSTDQRHLIHGGTDGSIKILDLETGEALHTLDEGPVDEAGRKNFCSINRLAVTSDNRLVAVSMAQPCTARIWSLETRSLLNTFEIEQSSIPSFVTSIAVSRDHKLILKFADGSIGIQNIARKPLGAGSK